MGKYLAEVCVILARETEKLPLNGKTNWSQEQSNKFCLKKLKSGFVSYLHYIQKKNFPHCASTSHCLVSSDEETISLRYSGQQFIDQRVRLCSLLRYDAS